ncbi:MAG: radical SAM protein [Acidobacteria bacterium]|nr:radical SAM protein [Acidobacteriota bacterium]
MSAFIQENDFAQIHKIRLQGIKEGKVLTGPQTVHIDLANGCNTNCTTCWDHSPLLTLSRTIEWKRKQFDFNDFSSLASDLHSMKSVEAVILSGMGDPFVNPAIYKIIKVCKNYGWHVTVLTNALLANPEKILSLKVDMMLISVNGVSPKSYTAFHPNLRSTDFDKLCSLLETFAWAGKRFKHVQVINRDTAPELVEMVYFANKYNAKSITYKLASLAKGTELCAITEEQRSLLLKELIPQAQEEAKNLKVETNLDVFQQQLKAGGLLTAPIEEIGCFMGWYYSRITVEGKILFCCSTEVEVGNLSKGKFSEQWFDNQWQEARENLMQGKYYSSCSQCGKLNQNVKIGKKVKEKFGEELYFLRTGRKS